MSFDTKARQEAELDELLDDWHVAGLSLAKFSRMLHLAKLVAPRYGLTQDDVLKGRY